MKNRPISDWEALCELYRLRDVVDSSSGSGDYVFADMASLYDSKEVSSGATITTTSSSSIALSDFGAGFELDGDSVSENGAGVAEQVAAPSMTTTAAGSLPEPLECWVNQHDRQEQLYDWRGAHARDTQHPTGSASSAVALDQRPSVSPSNGTAGVLLPSVTTSRGYDTARPTSNLDDSHHYFGESPALSNAATPMICDEGNQQQRHPMMMTSEMIDSSIIPALPRSGLSWHRKLRLPFFSNLSGSRSSSNRSSINSSHGDDGGGRHRAEKTEQTSTQQLPLLTARLEVPWARGGSHQMEEGRATQRSHGSEGSKGGSRMEAWMPVSLNTTATAESVVLGLPRESSLHSSAAYRPVDRAATVPSLLTKAPLKPSSAAVLSRSGPSAPTIFTASPVPHRHQRRRGADRSRDPSVGPPASKGHRRTAGPSRHAGDPGRTWAEQKQLRPASPRERNGHSTLSLRRSSSAFKRLFHISTSWRESRRTHKKRDGSHERSTSSSSSSSSTSSGRNSHPNGGATLLPKQGRGAKATLSPPISKPSVSLHVRGKLRRSPTAEEATDCPQSGSIAFHNGSRGPRESISATPVRDASQRAAAAPEEKTEVLLKNIDLKDVEVSDNGAHMAEGNAAVMLESTPVASREHDLPLHRQSLSFAVPSAVVASPLEITSMGSLYSSLRELAMGSMMQMHGRTSPPLQEQPSWLSMWTPQDDTPFLLPAYGVTALDSQSPFRPCISSQGPQLALTALEAGHPSSTAASDAAEQTAEGVHLRESLPSMSVSAFTTTPPLSGAASFPTDNTSIRYGSARPPPGDPPSQRPRRGGVGEAGTVGGCGAALSTETLESIGNCSYSDVLAGARSAEQLISANVLSSMSPLTPSENKHSTLHRNSNSSLHNHSNNSCSTATADAVLTSETFGHRHAHHKSIHHHAHTTATSIRRKSASSSSTQAGSSNDIRRPCRGGGPDGDGAEEDVTAGGDDSDGGAVNVRNNSLRYRFTRGRLAKAASTSRTNSNPLLSCRVPSDGADSGRERHRLFGKDTAGGATEPASVPASHKSPGLRSRSDECGGCTDTPPDSIPGSRRQDHLRVVGEHDRADGGTDGNAASDEEEVRPSQRRPSRASSSDASRSLMSRSNSSSVSSRSFGPSSRHATPTAGLRSVSQKSIRALQRKAAKVRIESPSSSHAVDGVVHQAALLLNAPPSLLPPPPSWGPSLPPASSSAGALACGGREGEMMLPLFPCNPEGEGSGRENGGWRESSGGEKHLAASRQPHISVAATPAPPLLDRRTQSWSILRLPWQKITTPTRGRCPLGVGSCGSCVGDAYRNGDEGGDSAGRGDAHPPRVPVSPLSSSGDSSTKWSRRPAVQSFKPWTLDTQRFQELQQAHEDPAGSAVLSETTAVKAEETCLA